MSEYHDVVADATAGKIDERLVRKYGERSFMYTEYPNLGFWDKTVRDPELRSAWDRFLAEEQDISTLLYVHIPHCHRQCLFCTCETIITLNYEDITRYLSYLYCEIDLYQEFFEKKGRRPQVREIHLGGGSPTYLREKEFSALVARLHTLVDVSALEEFSIEIDPRHVKPDKMRYYAEQGINRISFGVQDFNPLVQKSVDRVQPAILIERLMTPDLRNLFSHGVNFDIICGLPYQTPQTMRRTMKKVVEMSPDRVCFNYLHMRPDFFPYQLEMPTPPDNYQRKTLFRTALEVFEKSDYVRLGYDHFAKPTDDVARAMRQGQMQWNRLGTVTGRCRNTLGVGIHGMTMLDPYYYFQNFYSAKETRNDTLHIKKNYNEYATALMGGKFPIARGHTMSNDDIIRREVIHQLRSYFYLEGEQLEKKYEIDFLVYFDRELRLLKECVEDGIVEIHGKKIIITELGYEFADAVCSRFDTYIQHTV